MRNFSRLIIAATLLAIFIFVWRLNVLTPLWADDYCRMSAYERFGGALPATMHEYFSWTGRFLVTLVTYLVLGNYPTSLHYFNIANAAMFVGLLLIIFYISLGRLPKRLIDVGFLLLIFYLVFVGTGAIGEVAFWKTGGINYLSGVFYELVFLVPFVRFLKGKNIGLDKANAWVRGGYLTLAFMAATFYEHMAFGVTVGTLYLANMYHYGKVNLPARRFLKQAALLHFVGFLSLIGASGNYKRAVYETSEIILSTPLSIIQNLDFQKIISADLITMFFVAVFFVLITGAMNVKRGSRQLLTFFVLLALLTAAVYPFSRSYQPFINRIAFPVEAFFIICIINLFSHALKKSSLLRLGFFCYLALLIWGHTNIAYASFWEIKSSVDGRLAIITTRSWEEGASELAFPKVALPGINNYQGNWYYVQKYIFIPEQNMCLADYYKTPKIVVQDN